MKALRLVLVAFLTVVIVLSTCGALTFGVYVYFSSAFSAEYRQYLTIFLVLDVCAVALLAGFLRRLTGAASAVALGGLFHLLAYTLNHNWTTMLSPRFNVSATADVIVVMIMATAAYVSAQSSRQVTTQKVAASTMTRDSGSGKATRTLWSSLDQASKVAIITSLITAVTGILTAIITRSH
jgi:hypothetical protein